jgi:phage FluMu protein Com
VSKPARDLRCHCGSLIARIVDGKLEVKCRRCQRVGLLDLSSLGTTPEALEISWLPEPQRAKSR